MIYSNGSDYEEFERLSVEHRRLLRQEELILEVTEGISRALKEVSLTQSQLAAQLGKTKGYVSQLLSGGRNLTLRTLADVVDAMTCRIQVSIWPEHEVIEGPLEWSSECPSKLNLEFGEPANDDMWAKAA